MEKQKLIIISGPTGVGKTALSIELAKNSTVKLLGQIAFRYIKTLILVQLKSQKKKKKELNTT